MQPLASDTTPFLAKWVRWLLLGISVLGLAGLVGCPAPTPPPPPVPKAKPYEGVALTVGCSDTAFAPDVEKRVAGWAARVGAKVTVVASIPQDGADLAVIYPGEVGAFAAKGELEALPEPHRQAGSPLQWDRTLAAYRTNLTGWSRDPVAVTLAADGYALVYRADKFAAERHRKGYAERHGGRRQLSAPTTWEDVTEVAAYFAEADKAPSLPPVPADSERLMTLYHQIVACSSRESRATAAGDNQDNSLHFRVDDWRHRLDTPAFQVAMDWLARTHPLRPPVGTPDDPVTALDTGTAALAVLSLAEIARLPRDGDAVSARFKVAPLPGSRGYHDTTGKFVAVTKQANYVPYLGSAGRVAVVFKRSANAAAAWDLLAEIGGPAATTAAVSSAAGTGPFRIDHVDSSTIWVRYNFDPERTQALMDAMRHYVGLNMVNPAFALRTPDRATLLGLLEPQVRKAATGQTPPAAAMQAAVAAWTEYEAKFPDRAQLTKWRRNAVGLD